jgi:hypothetical protein
MRRSWLWLFCLLAGGLSAAGCTDYGGFEVEWQFVGGEGANTGCGQHGVDSIRVIGTSSEGERADIAATCTDGRLEHNVPVGSWTFSVRQLDVRGQPVDLDGNGDPVAPMASGVITDGATVMLDPGIVELTPRPACRDGVDNDNDGRVDLDDPQCIDPISGPNPNGTAE